MALFSGYYYIHSFASIIFPLSNIGFALLYFFYALGSLLGPSIVEWNIKSKIIIIICGIGYVIYTSAINSRIEAFYLATTPLLGFCAGLIWLEQGIFVAEISKEIGKKKGVETGGSISGLFYSIFNFCYIVGNLISLIVLLTGVSPFIIQWIMVSFCCIGVVMFFFIRTFDLTSENKKHFLSHFKERIISILILIKNKSFLILIPAIILQSAQVALTFQIMPKLILISSNNPTIIHVVTFLFYGIGSILACFSLGKIFDYKWFIAWIIISLCEIFGDVLLLSFGIWTNKIPNHLFYLVGFLRGSSDYALTTILSSIGIKWFGETSTYYFAAFRLLYCIFYVPISIITGYVQFYVLIALCGGLLLISTVFIAIGFKIIVNNQEH